MSWPDNFCALDLETSGLSSHARVLEVAVVSFEGGVPVRSFSQLLCPQGIDWGHAQVVGALSVNGLTREMLQGQPAFDAIEEALMSELAQPVLVGHNVAFDLRMLRYEFERLGKPLFLPLTSLLLDTMELSAYLNEGEEGNKLAEVASRYKVVLEGDAHRALSDAMTCGHILSEMLRQGALPESEAALAVLSERAHLTWNKMRGRKRSA